MYKVDGLLLRVQDVSLVIVVFLECLQGCKIRMPEAVLDRCLPQFSSQVLAKGIVLDGTFGRYRRSRPGARKLGFADTSLSVVKIQTDC